MIASILSLTPGDIKQARIRDAYSIHKVVYALFPGSQRTFLYYDQGGDARQRKILIVSQSHPAQAEYGTLQSKVVPEGFLAFRDYAFQIRLNPVRTVSTTGKRVPITGENELYTWFIEKSADWGFLCSPDSLELIDTGVQTIDKGSRTLTHNVAEYRGTLRVVDNARFRQSFESGIGKAKAFGFGLLQVSPIKKAN